MKRKVRNFYHQRFWRRLVFRIALLIMLGVGVWQIGSRDFFSHIDLLRAPQQLATRIVLSSEGRSIPAMVMVDNVAFYEEVIPVTNLIDCDVLDLTPLLTVLENYGDHVAIYFENLASGCTFMHNEERVFFGASIPKAPLALWLYQQAEKGLLNLDQTLYFSEQNKRMGSGIIRHRYDFGDVFTLRRLIGLNLYESDNTATYMIHQAVGYQGFSNFINSIGGMTTFGGNALDSFLTAKQVGRFAHEIYRYIESDQNYSAEFKYNLLNNQFPFIVSDYPVASKTGWYEKLGGAWHDMAIVYAPSPYILVILSADKTGTEEDHAIYQNISFAFQEFNGLNFGIGY